MLHLEDYLEMIEHLPQELRDRFTEMREMDLSVQNNTDALDKRARSLFQQCRRGELPTAAADAEFDAIRSDYYRVLEDSDEKIQLAGQMYDLVERYQRRLDTELYKFKCELEADHNGITEILEKRSLELDNNPTSNGGTNQKENRFYDAQNSYSGSGAGRADSRYKLKAVRRRESVAVTAAEKRAAAAAVAAAAAAAAASTASTSNIIPITNAHIRPRTPSAVCAGIGSGAIGSHPLVASASAGNVATYNLQICGAGNAIAAAASQAIAQTQQMQQGRRTASLKASYEAIGAMGSQELLINSELAGATHNALQAVERESNVFSNQRRQKKKTVSNTPSANTSAAGARGIPTVKVLSNNATVTPILTPNQLAQASFTLQVQQPPLQQQIGSVPGALVHPQQQQQQPVTIAQTSQFTVQQQPIAVQQQIQLHHTNTQVPLQHLQQVPHQQPILQQLSVQQQPSQPLQQTTTIKQLLPQQIQIANMNNQQQKHIILPQAPQSQQRLTRPQQFQQTLQSPQPMTTQLLQQTQQQVPATSQHASQQQLTLQQLPLQSLSQPQLIQAQASHSLPLSQPSQVQLQQLQQQLVHSQAQQKQQLQQLKTIQHQSLQPLAQTQQQHLVQQQVVHLQSQQTQLQQLQPLQQHHHIQITQQQLQQQQQTSQQTSQQLVQHQQLQISQQQQPQQQQQLQQPQQLQISQHQLIELQQKDSQMQQTIQQQQQVLQQQQQQLLQQTQQQPQLQIQHHLIQQQMPSQKQQTQQQKLIQQQQQQLQQQQLQVQPQQQFIAGHSSSGVLANVSSTMDLSMVSAANVSSTSLGSLDMSRTSTSSTSGTSSVVHSDAGMVVEQTPEGEWSYDPNEPRYCICNQVSYGDMVACDNEDCPFEWFHYPCVNITSSPKGKWYCPQCSSSMKRRASRKN